MSVGSVLLSRSPKFLDIVLSERCFQGYLKEYSPLLCSLILPCATPRASLGSAVRRTAKTGTPNVSLPTCPYHRIDLDTIHRKLKYFLQSQGFCLHVDERPSHAILASLLLRYGSGTGFVPALFLIVPALYRICSNGLSRTACPSQLATHSF